MNAIHTKNDNIVIIDASSRGVCNYWCNRKLPTHFRLKHCNAVLQNRPRKGIFEYGQLTWQVGKSFFLPNELLRWSGWVDLLTLHFLCRSRKRSWRARLFLTTSTTWTFSSTSLCLSSTSTLTTTLALMPMLLTTSSRWTWSACSLLIRNFGHV